MNINVQPVVYRAVQYPTHHEKSPLLPPNRFVYVDGRKEFEVETSSAACELYQKYSSFHCNRHNRLCNLKT